jgi:hypothetical protein
MSLSKFETRNLSQRCLENWVSLDLKVESGDPEKDIGIQKIKKTSFGLEVSVI